MSFRTISYFFDKHAPHRQTRRTLNVPVPFLSFELAKMTCDKFFMNSIVGPFQVNLFSKTKTSFMNRNVGPFQSYELIKKTKNRTF